MNRYLLFDAHCSLCRELAREIEAVAGKKVQTLPLYSDQALHFMKQVYPAGWQRAPYLVVENHGRVRAWTGFAAAVQMVRFLGPRLAWRVWQVTRRYGIFLPSARRAFAPFRHSRRSLLKTASLATAALAFWLGLRPARTAHAIPDLPCCEGAYTQCFTQYPCESNHCWNGSRDQMRRVDCYDTRAECMTLCSQTITRVCCNCC